MSDTFLRDLPDAPSVAGTDRLYLETGSIGSDLSRRVNVSALLAGVQAADPTLTALAGLVWTSGRLVVEMTGADTFTLRPVGAATGTDLLDAGTGDARYLRLSTGGTLTGVTLTLAPPTGSPAFAVNAPSGQAGIYDFFLSGVRRGRFEMTAAANLVMRVYDLAGALVATPFVIDNASGAATVTAAPRSVAGGSRDVVGRNDLDALILAGTNVTKSFNSTTGAVTINAAGGGASTFLGLTDTPSSYTGQAGRAVRVNSGETALEFFTAGGSGTVTEVSGSGGTTGLTLTGGPITTIGTLTLGGTLAVANGGTGATSAPAALSALGGVATTRQVASGTGLTGGGDLSADRTLALTGQALELHNLATNGLIARTGAGTVAARSIAAGANINVTNGDGVAGNPTVAVTGLAAVATSGSASDLSTGSLALARIAQGGATTGQVLEWNGSAWAPATDDTGGGGLSAIADRNFLANTSGASAVPVATPLSQMDVLTTSSSSPVTIPAWASTVAVIAVGGGGGGGGGSRQGTAGTACSGGTGGGGAAFKIKVFNAATLRTIFGTTIPFAVATGGAGGAGAAGAGSPGGNGGNTIFGATTLGATNALLIAHGGGGGNGGATGAAATTGGGSAGSTGAASGTGSGPGGGSAGGSGASGASSLHGEAGGSGGGCTNAGAGQQGGLRAPGGGGAGGGAGAGITSGNVSGGAGLGGGNGGSGLAGGAAGTGGGNGGAGHTFDASGIFGGGLGGGGGHGVTTGTGGTGGAGGLPGGGGGGGGSAQNAATSGGTGGAGGDGRLTLIWS